MKGMEDDFTEWKHPISLIGKSYIVKMCLSLGQAVYPRFNVIHTNSQKKHFYNILSFI
jgi:hypothetical protein